VPTSRPSTLVEAISLAIAANDPLEPWDAVSNYDEHYWDAEATKAESAIAQAKNEAEVFNALAVALDPVITGSGDGGEYARSQIGAASAAVWRWLQTEPRS
jgi:hypothetical protein